MPKIKKYPLEIENVGWDLMSKGHHDYNEFMEAAVGYYEWPLGKPKPRHVWLKVNTEDENSFNYVSKDTQGTFPATIVRND